MKTATSVSSAVLWTAESFQAIRPIIESALHLNEAIQRAGVMWTYKPILATVTANWCIPGVQAWSDEFTAQCNEIDLEFTVIAFDEGDVTQILTPSKNHILASTARYLGSELLLHDVPF